MKDRHILLKGINMKMSDTLQPDIQKQDGRRPDTQKRDTQKRDGRRPDTQKRDARKLDIRRLDIREAGAVYEAYLAEDFPPNERKPFSAIRTRMERQHYEVYAAYDRERLIGYAYLAKEERDGKKYALLDYFAVKKELRGQGFGSLFLRTLVNEILAFDCVLIESERVDSAENEEERRIRERRISFYLSCGAIRSGVHTFLYWVDYDILAFVGHAQRGDTETIRQITELMYHSMYPEDWFPKLARIIMAEK